jgi:hypothetical protein
MEMRSVIHFLLAKGNTQMQILQQVIAMIRDDVVMLHDNVTLCTAWHTL